jgi:hypothetical protein
MLIVIPEPCKLTPLLFRLSFFTLSIILERGGRPIEPGESVPSKSERSESSSDDSAKGKRPSASSMSEMPKDQTSDLTVYWAPCMRSGWTDGEDNQAFPYEIDDQ